MPKPSSRSNPDTPLRGIPRRPRSWPQVQMPHLPGTVPYDKALAAVRAVKERRASGNPA